MELFNINTISFLQFQVTEAGKETLPSWLHYSADGSTLEGVPQQQDVGQHYIEVQAVAPHSTQPMKDVFSVNVVEDTTTAAVPLKLTNKDSVQPIKCPQGSSVTTVTVIVDAQLNDLPPKERVQLLQRLMSHLNVASELLKLLPVGNKPMFDSQALVAGPGNVKQPEHEGALVQWEVGCGNVNAKHMPILQQVEATSQDGSMAEAIEHPIIGWHVTNNAPHIGRRMKRQINLAHTPTPVPTHGAPTKLPTRTVVVVETDEDGKPKTRTVPTMGTPTFTDIKPTGTHEHRHRSKSRGRHHKSKHPHPKHSPDHNRHRTRHPKLPKPTPTAEQIKPTATGDVPASSLKGMATKTPDIILVTPTAGYRFPDMSHTINIQPSIGHRPVKPTQRPTDNLPKKTRKKDRKTDGEVRPTKTDEDSRPTEGFNFAPQMKKHIQRIVVHVGDILKYRVPPDAFEDLEDGNTRNLKLVFLDEYGLTIPPNSWIKFDIDRQTLYGLPMRKDMGHKMYQFAAMDTQGKVGRDNFEIVVRQAPHNHKVNHEFAITFKLNYDDFMTIVEKRINMASKVAKLYGDKDASGMKVTRINRGSVIFGWANTTLGSEPCPSHEIQQLWKILGNEDNSLNQSFVYSMLPYIVKEASLVPKGACLRDFAPKTANKVIPSQKPETIEKQETPEDDVLITTVVPTVVIAAMLLIAACIACFLYRRKRTGKLTIDDQHHFVNKGIPIIFADELDDKPDPPTKPLIMDDEKPPLPPPEYPRSSSGSEPSTPPSDHKEAIETTEDEHDEHELNSPPYQPPPPFAQARDSRHPRPRVQPTYRHPPPYVPP